MSIKNTPTSIQIYFCKGIILNIVSKTHETIEVVCVNFCPYRVIDIKQFSTKMKINLTTITKNKKAKQKVQYPLTSFILCI